MADKYMLAHDIGTTGNKASLYQMDGQLVDSHYYPYQTFYPKPSYVEQDPDDWWKAFINSTQQVLSNANISPDQIMGLSFSGQMMAGIPVDKHGNILQKPVILWADFRSVKQAEEIKEKVGWESFYHITGAGMEIPLYPIAKLLWIKENLPEVYQKTHKFLGVKDVIIQRLTGRYVTDFSDASNTGLLDIHQKAWAVDMIREVGIDTDKLCDEILPSHTIVGQITKQAADLTNLTVGTPVILGGGDVSCAALGAGVIEKGYAYNYIGSASWLAVATPKPIIDDAMRPFTLCHVVPDQYVGQLAMFTAGVAFEWFRDQVCHLEKAYAGLSGDDAYDLMTKIAVKSKPGSNGLIFLPNMRPGGAPHHSLEDRGAIVGLTLDHTRSDMLRAVIEGITYNIRLMSEVMEKQVGSPFKELRMIGGGSKSPLWLDIEANILNKKIQTLSAHQEANSLGAAIIAGVGLGIFNDFSEGVEAYIKTAEVVEPRQDVVDVYENLFPLFNEAYASLCTYNEHLNKALK
jgi:xylulokinase